MRAAAGGLPRVSVVMPVRDGADHLQESLRSILQQTEPAFELIAVDDGSLDETACILDEHPDTRLRVVRRPREGIAQALNAGLAIARAPYVARMDADDIAHPDRLRRQADYLDDHLEVGLAAARARYLGDRDANRGLALWLDWSNALDTHEAIARERFVESPLVHPTVMFRRALVDSHGGYRSGDFPEDYELWLRWLEAGVRMAKLPQSLLDWRERPQRLTRTDPRYSVDAFFRMKAPYLARWLEARNPHHPRVVIWGAGRVTRRRLTPLLAGLEVEAWVDIDPKKIGWLVDSAPVVAPAELPPPDEAFVLVAVGKRGARALIETELRNRGYEVGRTCLFCA